MEIIGWIDYCNGYYARNLSRRRSRLSSRRYVCVFFLSFLLREIHSDRMGAELTDRSIFFLNFTIAERISRCLTWTRFEISYLPSALPHFGMKVVTKFVARKVIFWVLIRAISGGDSCIVATRLVRHGHCVNRRRRHIV